MTNVSIRVEEISKLYSLGQVGTGTLSRDLNRWWANVRGKEDPYAKIGQVNDRARKAESDFVWALKDISFEVKQGEVLGIIGRNGAGKSTLLKILSKITSPTTGKIYTKGRIASLLEVGTGFHPELTGRENIFMNGAILGMKKWEIQKKFAEIVDFSGVEAYIDTPVKRYSSGMYVRLAFAVAAFLDPEILIIDEVLAVGDAEFQKKCLGRMKDVSSEDGRTILFVSHNITAISSICNSAIHVNNGMILNKGEVEYVLIEYMNSLRNSEIKKSEPQFNGPLKSEFEIINVTINDFDPFTSLISIKQDEQIEIYFFLKSSYGFPFRTAISIYKEGTRLFTLYDLENHENTYGEFKVHYKIPNNFLRPGFYGIGFGIHSINNDWVWCGEYVNFEINDLYSTGTEERDYGLINIKNFAKAVRIQLK